MSSFYPAVRPASLDALDYEAIEAAVMETERGRKFLLEYARRLRAAETGKVLDALAVIERRLAESAPAPAPRIEPAQPESETRAQAQAAHRRLLEIAAAMRASGAASHLCEELESHAHALLRVVSRNLEAGEPIRLPRPAPARRSEEASVAPEPQAERAIVSGASARARALAAFAAIDALDRRARAALFA